MKLITNSKKTNHLVVIKESLKSHNRAFIAVAFLRITGIDLLWKSIEIFLKNGGILTLIAGRNFGLTEPDALMKLMKLFHQFPKSSLFLDKGESKSHIFHPKIFLFESDKDCSLVIGSSNLTRGGLETNDEASIIVYCKQKDKIWKDSKEYFQNLISINKAQEVNLTVIKNYEKYFYEQKKANSGTRPNQKSSKIFNEKNLEKYLKIFSSEEMKLQSKKRENNYKLAKSILNKIADDKSLNQDKFASFLDKLTGSKKEHNLWHSGSLFRLRKKVYPSYKEFQHLVQYIRKNRLQPAGQVFEEGKKIVSRINGAGTNYLTEIMMSYNNENFANMNNNPITVLRNEAELNIKKTVVSYDSYDYSEYCDLVKDIIKILNLKNMLEADSFFNYIYWEIKKNKLQ